MGNRHQAGTRAGWTWLRGTSRWGLRRLHDLHVSPSAWAEGEQVMAVSLLIRAHSLQRLGVLACLFRTPDVRPAIAHRRRSGGGPPCHRGTCTTREVRLLGRGHIAHQGALGVPPRYASLSRWDRSGKFWRPRALESSCEALVRPSVCHREPTHAIVY